MAPPTNSRGRHADRPGDEVGGHRGKTHSACAELLKDYKGMTEKVNIFAIFKKTPEYLR